MMMPAQVVIANKSTGKIKILAVVGGKRSEVFSDVPSIVEAGYPGAQASSWYGLSLPAKTARPIIERISVELEKLIPSPGLKQALQPLACTPESVPMSKFEAMIRDETELWARVLKGASFQTK